MCLKLLSDTMTVRFKNLLYNWSCSRIKNTTIARNARPAPDLKLNPAINYTIDFVTKSFDQESQPGRTSYYYGELIRDSREQEGLVGGHGIDQNFGSDIQCNWWTVST